MSLQCVPEGKGVSPFSVYQRVTGMSFQCVPEGKGVCPFSVYQRVKVCVLLVCTRG